MQIKDAQSSLASDFYAPDQVVWTPKYINDYIWTPNIDWYQMATQYLFFTTQIHWPQTRGLVNVPVEILLHRTNLVNTEFAECLKRLYDPNKENMDISEAIDDLEKKYTLSPYVEGRGRMFIRK